MAKLSKATEEEARAILETQAKLEEPFYLKDTDLTAFEAFGQEEDVPANPLADPLPPLRSLKPKGVRDPRD